jgi:heptosyltransferase-2
MTGPQPGSTLVIQTAFLGDVILTTPLLAVLAERYGPVDLVTTPAAAILLESNAAVRRVIRYDKRGKESGLRGIVALARSLQAEAYARVYLPHRSWRSGVIARMANIPERIGFSDGATIFYTRSVFRPRTGHQVERLLGLAAPIEGSEPPVSLALSALDYAAGDAWLNTRNLLPEFVALAPGSIWGTKRWPYYGEVARRLSLPSVVIGSPDDRALGEEIVAASGGQAHNAAGELSLRVSAALIARARILVTNDSAPLHLATAATTPIVAIFGPTVPAFGFGPRGPYDRIVEHPSLDCRPCSAHGPQVCPLGHHRCMRELAADQVIEAVEDVLKRSKV